MSRKVVNVTVELSCPNGIATDEQIQSAIDGSYPPAPYIYTETGIERWAIESIAVTGITTVDDSEPATADA